MKYWKIFKEYKQESSRSMTKSHEISFSFDESQETLHNFNESSDGLK